jgi:hypothetical protein
MVVEEDKLAREKKKALANTTTHGFHPAMHFLARDASLVRNTGLLQCRE